MYFHVIVSGLLSREKPARGEFLFWFQNSLFEFNWMQRIASSKIFVFIADCQCIGIRTLESACGLDRICRRAAPCS